MQDPVPEIFEAAFHLDAAVSAHLSGELATAEQLIRLADSPAIKEWTNRLWGKGGPWSRPLPVEKPLPHITRDQRFKERMPTEIEKRILLARDGHRCRFCGIPLVRAETRSLIRKVYPDALRWGGSNKDQHAAFEAMWLQYDHLIPHARGGTNDLDNIIVTCAPCNYGRLNLTLEEVGLSDPRERMPLKTTWDGLERFAAQPLG